MQMQMQMQVQALWRLWGNTWCWLAGWLVVLVLVLLLLHLPKSHFCSGSPTLALALALALPLSPLRVSPPPKLGRGCSLGNYPSS